MNVLSVVLLVLFIIVAVLLILLVLVQNEEGDSLGGVFAGGSSSVFGSRSGNILTKASSVLGALFLALSFGIALINRTPSDEGVEAAGRKIGTEQGVDWWQNETMLDENAPILESPALEGAEEATVSTENLE
ncbi:MAG: preprotein translocase subunit SecG [Spirochaetaceae bacterium]|jgi:preprotein translocase subunit SecG|nr:preprotein translocase subunit SecG [Spirochaetaceae bacterium]